MNAVKGWRWGAGGVVALAAGWGCASAPNPIVGQVRSEYEQAAQDPAVNQYAPGRLHEADQAVDRLAWADEHRQDEAQLEHLAYLARGRIEIARTAANEGALDQRAADLGKQRDELLIAANEAPARGVGETPTAVGGTQTRTEAMAFGTENGELQVNEAPEGVVFTMGDVVFASGRDDMQSGARDMLERVAQYLNRFPDRPVEIAGHTDSMGDAAYNQELSERRAQTVATFLEEQGVDAKRITVQGYGETKPLAPNTTLSGRQHNRRVEIIMSREEGQTQPGEQPQPEEQPKPKGTGPRTGV